MGDAMSDGERRVDPREGKMGVEDAMSALRQMRQELDEARQRMDQDIKARQRAEAELALAKQAGAHFVRRYTRLAKAVLDALDGDEEKTRTALLDAVLDVT